MQFKHIKDDNDKFFYTYPVERQNDKHKVNTSQNTLTVSHC